MNIQNYKAASERTDADERALIPPFRKSAPAQAQHSPLLARNICPHASVSFPDIDVRNLTKGQLTEEYAECNSQRQVLKARAQRLADAISEAIRLEDETILHKALAQWEQAQ